MARNTEFSTGYGESVPLQPAARRARVDPDWRNVVNRVDSFYGDTKANEEAVAVHNSANDPITHELRYQGYPDEEPDLGIGRHNWEDVRPLVHEWKAGQVLKEHEMGGPLTAHHHALAAYEADRHVQSIEEDMRRGYYDDRL